MPFSFAALLNYKLASPKLVREVTLEAKRFTGKELHAVGVVDILAENGAGVLQAARDLAEKNAPLAKTGVWGLMKVCAFPFFWRTALNRVIVTDHDHFVHYLTIYRRIWDAKCWRS